MADLDALRKALGPEISDEVLSKVSKLVVQEQGKVAKKALEDATANAGSIVKAAIGKALAQAEVIKALEELAGIVGGDKSFGITIPYTDPKGFVTRTGASAPRASGAGGGNGGGKSKDEFGMTLNEIFEMYATQEDREKLDAGGTDKNKVFSAKNAVKNRAIKEGLLVKTG